MGLLKKVAGGWQGIATGRVYYPPQECKESAEAQERQHAKTLPLQLPKDVKPGSAEEARMRMQEEALSNVQRADLADTSLAYREFAARHPEFVNDDFNAGQLCEYFALKGVPIVTFADTRIPLATSAEQWEEAFQWKTAMGQLRIDPTIQDAQERVKAQQKATEYVTRKPTEEEHELPWDGQVSR